ncbi:class I adenylate-forming enzyme family protein [Tahibacter harae]|uniref:class I adenylate-forming enzyme family protein n=1 Tax=Tahibacter harae TaxID=2963937 RepID=UPI0031B9ACAA
MHFDWFEFNVGGFFVSFSHFVQQWRGRQDDLAVVCDDKTFSYAELAETVDSWSAYLQQKGLQPGDCVAMAGTISIDMIALVIALVQHACIVVPFLSANDVDRGEALEAACVDYLIEFDAAGEAQFSACGHGRAHPLLDQLRGDVPEAGLILFTSGSTGKNKASVHRFSRLISNVTRKDRRSFRALIFLMFDHIGGMNTLLHTLCHGGTAVFVPDRSVDTVCRAIEQHKVELLPTTPTFLNMVLISELYRQYDLSSLRMVTYGTEPMLPATLSALNIALPNVRCKQTYGLTEAGILPTQSEGQGSLFMKVGGENYETKVVDGILHIRSDSAMLGYLNAPSPFCEEGWLNTGDRVEMRDGFMRILGRDSEIINVGGEKVYPTEIENIILGVSNIGDVVVSGKKSAVTGQLVIATVLLKSPEEAAAVERRVRRHCQQHLPAFKVPAAIKVTYETMHSSRFKKMRKRSGTAAAAAPAAEANVA